jgi:hypothetical protein
MIFLTKIEQKVTYFIIAQSCVCTALLEFSQRTILTMADKLCIYYHGEIPFRKISYYHHLLLLELKLLKPIEKKETALFCVTLVEIGLWK